MPVECIAGGGVSQRSIPPPFLTKLYQLVSDASVDDFISWNEDGSTFIVWRPAEFARDILPKHFKHNNFSSFVRQLNTYRFKKITPERFEFSHDLFKRGEKGLLWNIQRRQISPSPSPSPVRAIPVNPVTQGVKKAVSVTNSDEQVISSTSSPGATTATEATLPAVIYATRTGSLSTQELMEDNERLRRENSRMSEELKKLKTLCGSIYRMMSDYYVHQGEPSGGVVAEGKNLEFLAENPVREEVNGGGSAVNGRSLEDELDLDSSPRLFGVCLKRRRLSDESANSD